MFRCFSAYYAIISIAVDAFPVAQRPAQIQALTQEPGPNQRKLMQKMSGQFKQVSGDC